MENKENDRIVGNHIEFSFENGVPIVKKTRPIYESEMKRTIGSTMFDFMMANLKAQREMQEEHDESCPCHPNNQKGNSEEIEYLKKCFAKDVG